MLDTVNPDPTVDPTPTPAPAPIPLTVGDLVGAKQSTASAVKADAEAIRALDAGYHAQADALQARLAVDTTADGAADAAIAAEILAGGPFAIPSPDGLTTTGYDPGGPLGYTPTVYRNAGAPVTATPPPPPAS